MAGTSLEHGALVNASSNRFNDKEAKVEEVMRQKFHAKCRFKAAVRMVLNNIYWLAEGVAVYEGDNVKMRVEQAIRTATKAKSQQLLHLNDKALLNKPAKERTESEKKYLYRLIGGLKCFKRYPKIVKKKLAAVTYFKYYGPERVIVKQHQEAHALYFIMSGEVIVSLTVFDELMQKNISVDVGQMGVGTMFGEVSLLHNIPRTATCTTSGHCEFLQLMKEDFKTVLQHSVQKQWDTIKQAMSAFTYFNGLDDVSRRECCIVSRIKSFKPKETILGDNVGAHNFVYFVLSGRAQMIESLDIVVSDKYGRKEYRLLDKGGIEVEEDSQSKLENKYFHSKSATEAPKSNTDPSQSKGTFTSLKNTSEPSTVKCSTERNISICPESINFKENNANEEESKHFKSDDTNKRRSKETKSQDKEDVFPDFILQPQDERQSSSRIALDPSEKSSRKSSQKSRTFFMQVCEFLPGASFGFGENMRDRRIVAITHVDVLMMPTVWLLQRNINNIWTRIRHYLDRKIPSKKELFQEFVSQRKWHDYKEKIVKEAVRKTKRINFTTIHDVPYSIRMNECLDI